MLMGHSYRQSTTYLQSQSFSAQSREESSWQATTLAVPLKWCGISIATVLACSCVCLARSGHLVGPPVGSCEPGLLLHHGTCGPNGVATALVKSSVSSSCI